MPSDLFVEGPFAIDFEKSGSAKRIRKSDGIEFWCYDDVAHLRRKQGCYVFAIRAGKGFTPWYVGQASKGFEGETFTYHKRDHYNDALFRNGAGRPVLFFVTPQGNHRKVPTRDLNQMEKELIQFAIARNPDLCNIMHTRNLPRWTIHGVIRSGPGAPGAAAMKFRK